MAEESLREKSNRKKMREYFATPLNNGSEYFDDEDMSSKEASYCMIKEKVDFCKCAYQGIGRS